MKSESIIDRDTAPWPYSCDDDDDNYIEPYDETEDVRPGIDDWNYGL